MGIYIIKLVLSLVPANFLNYQPSYYIIILSARAILAPITQKLPILTGYSYNYLKAATWKLNNYIFELISLNSTNS
jgi:hypothetical protein